MKAQTIDLGLDRYTERRASTRMAVASPEGRSMLHMSTGLGLAVRVADLSAGGARVEMHAGAASRIAVGDWLQLETTRLPAPWPALGDVVARVAWCRGDTLGLEFITRVAEVCDLPSQRHG